MARGKNSAKSTNRRRKALEETLTQLTAELAAEEKALTVAEEALAKTEQLRERVRSEVVGTQEETSGYAATIKEELDYVRTTLIRYSEHADKAIDSAEKYTDRCIGLTPGSTGTERIENYMRAMGVEGTFAGDQPKTAKKLPTESVRRLQRIRGDRRSNTEPWVNTENGLNSARLRASVRRQLGTGDSYKWLHADRETLPDAVGIEMEEIISSAPAHSNPTLVHAWATGPVMNQASVKGSLPQALGHRNTRAVGSAFGAPSEPDAADRDQLANLLFKTADSKGDTENDDANEIPAPVSSMTADDRKATADQTPENVLHAWRTTFNSRELVAEKMGYSTLATSLVPRHPRPSYGAVAHHIYARAAIAGWLHVGRADLMAEVAVGMGAAATYWLPAGQTAAFADSEPPAQAELDSMTLPFPQVFVAFADPVAINASTSDDDGVLAGISNIAHRTGRGSFDIRYVENELAQLMGQNEDPVLSVSDVAAVAGARIDGLLLLSDELGQPEDRFAWCLRIPGQYGTSLSRMVIPALRSKTEHRQLVDNITAVTSWAHWHQPSSEDAEVVNTAGSESREALRRLEREGAGVHIVDTSRTKRGTPKEGAASTGDTRNVAPHVRRAHWRKQRYGSGLRDARMVHIAATVVNIHRGNMQHQVYTLPPAS